MKSAWRCLAATLLWVSAALAMAAPDLALQQQQVFAAERAFARSMAERRHENFVRHLSQDTLFFGRGVLRGKAEVAAAWKAFYEGPQAPFSWEPDQVEVTADGLLALSTGLVRDPAGNFTNRFISVWRLEAPGVWRVVMDRGSPLTEAEKKLP